MPAQRRLLLLQLPRLDPDVTAPGENVMLAAACLQSALARADEGSYWNTVPTPAIQDTADNATLLAAVADLRPDVIGATLYLWNVERTLRLLAALKRSLPHLRTVVGGPEVACEHPLLYAPTSAVDVAVIGEGEAVFPGILKALRCSGTTNWRTIAWQQHGQLCFGARTPPARPLIDLLPDATHPICRPDAHGMAYLETNRGCPMRCAFCCYNLRRKGWSSLPPDEVEHRIRILRDRGAREIRLVDPTFNAHPRFRDLLSAMRRANADSGIRFFVELRADTLTEQDAADLAAAHVVEAEVGVQSTDPIVLRCLHRPTRLDRVLDGIERLQRHGIRPTIDFMYGLPHQGLDDIERSLDVLARFPDAHQQFLPTLLLPGTELRNRRHELKLRSQRLPPYRVLATDRFTSRQLAAIETLAEQRLGVFDTPTRRFVGKRLPDLFAKKGLGFRVQGSGIGLNTEHRTLHIEHWHLSSDAGFRILSAPSSNCRTVCFVGDNLYAERTAIMACIRQTVRHEPDVLWQFVLAPQHEEPLDLLEDLVALIRRLPTHWLDRLVSPPGRPRLAARRLFVKLPRGSAFDPGWRVEAEALLADAFH